MTRLFPIIFLFVLSTFASCTIEKRLYNRGFHVEINHLFSKSKYVVPEEADTVIQQAEEAIKSDCIQEEENLVAKNDFTINNPESQNILAQPEIESDKETALSHRPFTKAKKQDILVGLGFSVMLTGVAAATFLGPATAAGASFSAMIIGGLLGWPLAFLSAILLLVFLIYLCIPPVEKRNQIPEEDRKFSKGERTGLIVAGIFAFGILIAFLSPLLNG